MSDILADELLPARMLNEFTYCPRLAFLEWVQGEWADNPDTLDGEFVHRNADQPDHRAIPEPGDTSTEETTALHSRSVRLENPELGIVAVIDILEVEGDVATPVDYKRSQAPDLPEGAWEPERVQLCAQGLLLRAAGYTCHEGVIWFAGSRRRVTIPFDDTLVSRTKELIQQCREMAQSGKMPLPLVDSPKCPRCSLVGICLPDETHLLLNLAAPAEESPQSEPDSPRLLLAPRPESIPLHVIEPGARVGKRAERLVIEQKLEKLGEARLKDVSQVCLYGPVQMSTQAMHELFDRGIPICYFSTGGWFRGIAHGLPHKNIELRIRQHAHAADPQAALALATQFVSGKIRNSRTILRRNSENDQLQGLLERLAQFAREAEVAESIPTLMGIEGMAAKTYFSAFAGLFKEERGFAFEGRNRRPPTDPVNAVLSFLYSALARELTVAALAVGLDPYLGFLHQPRYGRPALALDLAEEFRSLLADSTVLTLFNTGELKQEHFIARAGAITLKPAGKRAVLSAWERRLNSDVTHPIFGYTISYRRVLMVQARLLARVLSGELTDYPTFKTR